MKRTIAMKINGKRYQKQKIKKKDCDHTQSKVVASQAVLPAQVLLSRDRAECVVLSISKLEHAQFVVLGHKIPKTQKAKKTCRVLSWQIHSNSWSGTFTATRRFTCTRTARHSGCLPQLGNLRRPGYLQQQGQLASARLPELTR